MSAARIVVFDAATPEPQTWRPDAAKVTAGDPVQTAWNHYSDASGQFSSGIWQAEPGTWSIRYTEEEFCHILEGTSVITAEDGLAVTVQAGQSFVVPRGFVGTWQVMRRTRKLYVVWEPKG